MTTSTIPETTRGLRPRAPEAAPARAAAGRAARGRAVGLARAAGGRVRDAADELGPVLTSVALVVPVVMAALFYVWVQVDGVRLGYEMAESKKLHEQLLGDQKALRTERQALTSPDRLQAEAGLLHLHPARPDQIIHLAGANP